MQSADLLAGKEGTSEDLADYSRNPRKQVQ
jgi:hypothetical protein